MREPIRTETHPATAASRVSDHVPPPIISTPFPKRQDITPGGRRQPTEGGGVMVIGYGIAAASGIKIEVDVSYTHNIDALEEPFERIDEYWMQAEGPRSRPCKVRN